MTSTRVHARLMKLNDLGKGHTPMCLAVPVSRLQATFTMIPWSQQARPYEVRLAEIHCDHCKTAAMPVP